MHSLFNAGHPAEDHPVCLTLAGDLQVGLNYILEVVLAQQQRLDLDPVRTRGYFPDFGDLEPGSPTSDSHNGLSSFVDRWVTELA